MPTYPSNYIKQNKQRGKPSAYKLYLTWYTGLHSSLSCNWKNNRFQTAHKGHSAQNAHSYTCCCSITSDRGISNNTGAPITPITFPRPDACSVNCAGLNFVFGFFDLLWSVLDNEGRHFKYRSEHISVDIRRQTDGSWPLLCQVVVVGVT
jgi:hypothetical protein